MAESNRRVVKKKWGKVWEHNVIKRAATIDSDKVEEITKFIEGAKVVTPQELANKQGIRVSLARKILSTFEEEGALTLIHKNGNSEIYSK